MSGPYFSGVPLAYSPRRAQPTPGSLDLAGSRESQGARTPSSARRPAQPRPGWPPSSSRASPVITTGLLPRAAPVVRGRPQACVRGRPETRRVPGRAQGSRVQAALQAAPLTPAACSPARAGSSPPCSRRGEPRSAPSSRRGASPNTPPSRLTSPGRAATPRTRLPPTLSRAAPGSPPPRLPDPGPAYRSCRAGSAALGPRGCPRPPSRVLPCP